MIGSFSFNGIESSTFNLVCKSVKRPLLPAAKVNRIEIPGASGAYDFDDDSYDLRTITMQIAYIGTSYEELRTRARQIAAWLAVNNWVRLIINDEPDKYYLAKVTSETDLQSLWESGTADITFDCQPFAYSVEESIFVFNVTEPMTYEFNNPGTRKIDFRSPQGSKFIISVMGSWASLNFTLNGQSLTYSQSGNSNAVVEIDNINMSVIQNGGNSFDKLDGDIDTFLSIIPGDNILTVGGSGLNISMSIIFIPIWI